MSEDRPDRPDAQEAVWRDIVEHFGDRVELTPDDTSEDVTGNAADVRRPMPRPADDPDRWAVDDDLGDPEAHYLPPPPPPLPHPTGARLLAWLGLFGSPAVMLLCLLLSVTVPSLVGVLLFFAFLGGFGYLVATMRKHDDSDPWDDGAVI